eukprot:g4980.t1
MLVPPLRMTGPDGKWGTGKPATSGCPACSLRPPQAEAPPAADLDALSAYSGAALRVMTFLQKSAILQFLVPKCIGILKDKASERCEIPDPLALVTPTTPPEVLQQLTTAQRIRARNVRQHRSVRAAQSSLLSALDRASGKASKRTLLFTKEELSGLEQAAKYTDGCRYGRDWEDIEEMLRLHVGGRTTLLGRVGSYVWRGKAIPRQQFLRGLFRRKARDWLLARSYAEFGSGAGSRAVAVVPVPLTKEIVTLVLQFCQVEKTREAVALAYSESFHESLQLFALWRALVLRVLERVAEAGGESMAALQCSGFCMHERDVGRKSRDLVLDLDLVAANYQYEMCRVDAAQSAVADTTMLYFDEHLRDLMQVVATKLGLRLDFDPSRSNDNKLVYEVSTPAVVGGTNPKDRLQRKTIAGTIELSGRSANARFSAPAAQLVQLGRVEIRNLLWTLALDEEVPGSAPASVAGDQSSGGTSTTKSRVMSARLCGSLLHEMGHAFHFLGTPLEQINGLEPDVMEFPSTVMQFLWEDQAFLREVLSACQKKNRVNPNTLARQLFGPQERLVYSYTTWRAAYTYDRVWGLGGVGEHVATSEELCSFVNRVLAEAAGLEGRGRTPGKSAPVARGGEVSKREVHPLIFSDVVEMFCDSGYYTRLAYVFPAVRARQHLEREGGHGKTKLPLTDAFTTNYYEYGKPNQFLPSGEEFQQYFCPRGEKA